MSQTTDLSVKERLRRAIAKPLDASWPTQLHRDLLAELERLEAGPCHQTCVFEPIQGYPHESDCIGCRMEKSCYKCGHFVDVLSKHR